MQKKNNWSWVPSLYIAEGLPYAIIMTLSIAMYKDFGVSNTEIAFYTSWLYLPWVIKPLWSPFVDIFRTKRWWVMTMQTLLGVGMAGIAFALSAPYYFKLTIAIFWIMAFCSSTHDIAIDGFYMLALDQREQSFFIGIRSTFYKIAQWLGNGALLIVVGLIQSHTSVAYSWMLVFLIMAGFFIAIMLYHRSVVPGVETVRAERMGLDRVFRQMFEVFVTFFNKKGVVFPALVFILVYRLGEAMLIRMKTPFLLDPLAVGGMGLTKAQCGVVDGTVGMLCMVAGGILGGYALSRKGLKYWLWFMLLCMAVPNAVYIYLAYAQPSSLWVTGICVGLEQLGYGFGFTAFTLYLMYIARGKYKTSHFAISTGFMALGMMLPGMIAGWLQEKMGYQLFFVLVFILGLVVMAVVPFLKVDPEYGKSS